MARAKTIAGAPLHSLKQTSTGETEMNQNMENKNMNQTSEEERTITGDMQPQEIPEGSFAGTDDRVIRTRKGKPVARDSGDQGGGQN
jgi:hypothetical protein